jgi:hypothetical protein
VKLISKAKCEVCHKSGTLQVLCARDSSVRYCRFTCYQGKAEIGKPKPVYPPQSRAYVGTPLEGFSAKPLIEGVSSEAIAVEEEFHFDHSGCCDLNGRGLFDSIIECMFFRDLPFCWVCD